MARLRDVVLLIVGALGILHETIVTPGERPVLLGLYAAVLGVPLIANGRRR